VSPAGVVGVDAPESRLECDAPVGGIRQLQIRQVLPAVGAVARRVHKSGRGDRGVLELESDQIARPADRRRRSGDVAESREGLRGQAGARRIAVPKVDAGQRCKAVVCRRNGTEPSLVCPYQTLFSAGA